MVRSVKLQLFVTIINIDTAIVTVTVIVVIVFVVIINDLNLLQCCLRSKRIRWFLAGVSSLAARKLGRGRLLSFIAHSCARMRKQ